MPPKAADKQKKAADKARAGVRPPNLDDKTFGLKNKNKSVKVQQYVKTLESSLEAAQRKKMGTDAKAAKKDQKEREAQRQKELDELFAEAIKQPKVPVGVDPKSIVCEFFRHGKCTKGFKCKFAHDLAVERKGGKIDIFSDRREDGEEDDMGEWDQEKLEAVVAQKHGAEKGNANRATDIICKFFLDAVEGKQYGWFWQCPNGKDCKYRHALPSGYVLKSQMKELLEAEAANSKSIEDVIEEERAKVDARTPITEEVFKKWAGERAAERKRKRDEELAERKRKGILSGREIFSEEGFLAEDDLGASDVYEREDADAQEAEFEREGARAEAANAAACAAAGRPAGQGAAASAPAPAADAGTVRAANGGGAAAQLSAEDAALFDEDVDDEDIDDDELDELEASLAAKAAVS
ncbi:hypothetical protein WJX81_000013 [Elliptochloris bilobata]|uniref:C3H1-type domain-containing protein n=1 Tax=Elliptochloris bilobata TaxID=381761 RepID=A0AAW1SJL4_9CHLO